jgi:hypothetical protein
LQHNCKHTAIFLSAHRLSAELKRVPSCMHVAAGAAVAAAAAVVTAAVEQERADCAQHVVTYTSVKSVDMSLLVQAGIVRAAHSSTIAVTCYMLLSSAELLYAHSISISRKQHHYCKNAPTTTSRIVHAGCCARYGTYCPYLTPYCVPAIRLTPAILLNTSVCRLAIAMFKHDSLCHYI